MHRQFQFQPGRVAPQILEAVKPALLLVKNMHDHVAEIDDHPLARGISVHRIGFHVFLRFQAVLDLPGDGLDVRVGCRGADEKEIGEAGNAAQVERDDVLCFFVRGVFGAESGELV